MFALAIGNERFGFGGEDSIAEVIMLCVVGVLAFPGFQLYESIGIRNDAFMWMILFGNSVLWGSSLRCVILMVRQMYHRTDRRA